MSPIQGLHEDNTGNKHKNFFRDDPEKQLSKTIKGYTEKELADYSKHLLIEDKAELKQKNLKMVERQKRKA